MKIGIIRSASSAVSKNQYNIQEIGLAKELANLGVEVDVFLISDKNKTYREKCGLNNNVTIYWLKGIKIPGQQGYYKDLKKILNQNKYDLIQALDDSQITTILVSEYCRKKKIKFVLWQGMYENYPEIYKRIIQYVFDLSLLKILRKNTKYTISKTTSAQNYLTMKKFPKGVVIPVGLEASNFDNPRKIDYREKLNIPKNQKIFLYIGKVEERRKPFFCIDLYKKIKDKYDNCCLVYVGDGPLKSEIDRYIKINNIKDVHLIKKIPQNELPSLYECCELFILPTRYEIFGMVLIESMYFGTPVITYSAAGPKDLIDDEKNGLIMNDFEINNWFSKIEQNIFIENKNKDMGKKAKEKIKNKYLWTNIAKIYYDEYNKIIAKK